MLPYFEAEMRRARRRLASILRHRVASSTGMWPAPRSNSAKSGIDQRPGELPRPISAEVGEDDAVAVLERRPGRAHSSTTTVGVMNSSVSPRSYATCIGLRALAASGPGPNTTAS